MMEKHEGLPMQHFFTHHEEPRSRNLVSEYDDKYNRHGYNPVLPPLRIWNGRKLAWIPQKSDFPILEPPTNYGLLEHLMKKWQEEEVGAMNSVYTISYEIPLIYSFANCQLRQPVKIHELPSNQGHLLQTVSRILGYEGDQKYLQAIGDWLDFQLKDTVRVRRVCRATVAPIGKVIPHQSVRSENVCGRGTQTLSWLHEPESSIVNEIFQRCESSDN